MPSATTRPGLELPQSHPCFIEPGHPSAPIAVGAVTDHAHAITRLTQRSITRLLSNRPLATLTGKQTATTG